MPKLAVSIVAMWGALAVAAPAVAQPHPGRAAGHRANPATTLSARIATINARIEMLSEQGAISPDLERALRQQSRRLQSHLYGLSAREVSDLETAIDRLERQVRFAADDARWGRHLAEGDEIDRFDQGERYDSYRHIADRDDDYEHFDRYTGSSVDRWHDPFDRGDDR